MPPSPLDPMKRRSTPRFLRMQDAKAAIRIWSTRARRRRKWRIFAVWIRMT